MAFDWGVIDVVHIVWGGASVKLRRAIVCELAVAANSKATNRVSTNVALELSGWWSKNAASSLGVGDLAVLDGVGAFRIVASDTILAVAELAHGTGLASRGRKRERAISGHGDG